LVLMVTVVSQCMV